MRGDASKQRSRRTARPGLENQIKIKEASRCERWSRTDKEEAWLLYMEEVCRVGGDRKKDPWMSPDLAMLGKLETLGQALDGSLT